MEMTIGLGAGVAQPSAVTPGAEVAPEGVGASVSKGLGEELLKIVRTAGKDDRQSKLETLKMISRMIDQHFKVLMDIAKNMGVSEEERKAAEQRLKELAKKRDELERRKKEDLKDEQWEDLLEFLEQMVDPADREALEKQRGEWELKG